MELWKFWKWGSRFMIVSKPGTSSYSSHPAAAPVRKARLHDTMSDTVPPLDLSPSSDFVKKGKSVRFEATSPCSTSSTSACELSSSWDACSSSQASSSLTDGRTWSTSSTAAKSTTIGCERVERGEITPEIVPDVEGTVPPSLFDELKQVFETFDANKDGKISASELRGVLQSLGDNATEEEAVLMLMDVDTDGDGHIDLEEFISITTSSLASPETATSSDELKAAFNLFDLNREGYITAEKLRHVLGRLRNDEYTLEECQKMIKGVDLDGDGKVNFQDFKRMMA